MKTWRENATVAHPSIFILPFDICLSIDITPVKMYTTIKTYKKYMKVDICHIKFVFKKFSDR